MTSNTLRFFDSHLHIIDARFPLVANQGYLPEPFLPTDYLQQLRSVERLGGCIVSGSFQGFDQSYLIHALDCLGHDYVGVTQLPASCDDEQILALDKAGVRGVRFNLRRGGSEDIKHLDRLARRVYELAGWHIELYIDARELSALTNILNQLPAVSIDHLGLSREGLPTLLKLVESGVRVKATGFGRLNFKPEEAIRAIYKANPQALMFGTDLPSTRAPRPFSLADATLIIDCLEAGAAQQVMISNARNFYRLDRH